MPNTLEQQFIALADAYGVEHRNTIRAVNNYQPAIVHRDEIYVSGQLPRVGDQVAVTGRVGDGLAFEEAQRAARICVLRGLSVIRQTLGSLDRLDRVLKMTVYVHSAADFIRQSEVADAASELLYTLLGPNGGHTRSSVGVAQLPKNAAVEIDLVAAILPAA